ncbi:MAG: response regulator [Bacteroidota bacterium]|jgi:DNA-binding NarL/FixJ family response regulator
MKSVVVIDDDKVMARLMQDNINQLSGYNCLNTYSGPNEYLSSEVFADIVLLDIVMPEMNGLDAIEKILDKSNESAIIINSIKDDSDTIFRAIQLGAVGYIDKQSFVNNFQEVFLSVENDGAYMTPKIARKVFSFFQKPKGINENLSQRENEIVQGILDGLSYKLISDRYNISIDTVRFHIKSVYRKLKINSKAELFKVFKNKI